MSPPETPNPERRSTGAIACFAVGAALTVLGWFLGVGGVMTTALSGGDAGLITGGIGMVIGLMMATALGIVLMLIGGVWMFAQVVADQRGEPSEKRYRDVER
jgi:hypothetical protein